MDLTTMERVGDRWKKMEGSCSTGQSPQWAVVPMEEEDIYNMYLYTCIYVITLIAERQI
jgi:hypothetical protein